MSAFTASESTVVIGVAAGACALSMPLVLRWLRARHVVDQVSVRSSHNVPTLRGGGIGVAFGAGVAAAVGSGLSDQRVRLLGAAAVLFAFAALGLWDDLRPLTPQVRFTLQFLLAPVAAWILLEPSASWGAVLLLLAATIWIVGFVNVFNFMDGINGISTVTALIAGLAYAVSAGRVDEAGSQLAALAVAGAALGFLPFNFPQARVFLGDVGSYFLGAAVAMIAVRLLWAGAALLEVAAPVVLYCADTGTTLLRRVARGERWWEPHREHVYQRLANGPLDHTRTTLLVAALTAALSIGGLAA